MTLTVLVSGSGLQLLVLVYTLLLLVFRLGRSSASCPAYKSAPVLVGADSEETYIYNIYPSGFYIRISAPKRTVCMTSASISGL